MYINEIMKNVHKKTPPSSKAKPKLFSLGSSILIFLLFGSAILIAPIGLLFYHMYTLDFSEESLYQQLHTLSLFSFSEEIASTDSTATTTSQTLTVTVTEENMSTMLHHAFAKNLPPFVTISNVTTTISPEMILLEVSLQFGLWQYRIFETTVFSEWLARVSQATSDANKTRIIEIKPVTMHTNHLYTVNFSKFWRYATHTDISDGWLALSSTAQFGLQDLVLQEHKVFIGLNL